ncbi:MAG TPA: alkaline phosphatase family protein [Egibacteraceae bacterium]|nr:alkaline phosphatase family protein [Egibacteraceae bacterium]
MPPSARRRSPLRLLVAAVAVLTLPALALLPAPRPAAAAGDPLRVYVLVTDGLEPQEVTTAKMPRLAQLKAEGVWYEQASAVMVAETTPNHVAMATGMLPENNGIVGNSAFDPDDPDRGDAYQDDPRLLTADTTVTRLERDCEQEISTATIQSKTYLFNIFREGGSQKAADFPLERRAVLHPGERARAGPAHDGPAAPLGVRRAAADPPVRVRQPR